MLAFFEALGGVTEEADDALDRLFHSKKIRKFWVDLDGAVHKDATETRVLARIDHYRLANGAQHAFGGAGIIGRIIGALAQILLERELDVSPVFVQP